jgi:HK97 family phage major capsid protein
VEQEIVKLRTEVREAEATAAREREAAEAVVASMRAEGVDMTRGENFTKVDEAYKSADKARDLAVDARLRLDRLQQIAGGTAEPRNREEGRQAEVVADMAKRFLESEPYKRVRSSGVLETSGSVNMDPVRNVMTRDEMMAGGLRLRTTFDNSVGVGSGLLTPDYTGKLVEQLVRKVRLLDIITVGSTDTDTVDYILENARTDAAGAAPYGTAVGESAYGFQHTQTSVKRLGHFVPATKGILADAGQTRTLLSSRLVNGLERKVEQSIWSGAGGNDLAGIVGTSGILTRAVGTDTQYDAIHKAKTDIVVNSQGALEATVLGIHPTDYEKLVLAKDSQGRYLNADPTADQNRTIWGLVPVVSVLFTQGSPYVGDFREAVTFWLREGISLSASDQHQDFFTKGLVALMAETRAAMAVTQPKALNALSGF